MSDIKTELYNYYQEYDAGEKIFECGLETLNRILSHNPKHVLEFGCNNGKNLIFLKLHSPEINLLGIDFSYEAVMKARSRGLSVRLRDEKILDTFPDKCFDVTFTISVLDHIPEIDHIIEQFERITRIVVYLAETNEKCSKLYFPHDYSKHGYQSLKQITSPRNPIGNGAVYDIWSKMLN